VRLGCHLCSLDLPDSWARLSGARYEGQWKQDAKDGDGIYVFEDGSTWEGSWQNDQPVACVKPFLPAGKGPCLHIEDLLRENAAGPSAAKCALLCQDNPHYTTWMSGVDTLSTLIDNQHVSCSNSECPDVLQQ
jgi:MORN repeat